MKQDVAQQATSSIASSTFSGEVLFRVRLTPTNIDLFVKAVQDGLIYDGTEADLVDRLALLENRILERHQKGQDYSRLEEEEDILHSALTYMRDHD